MDFGQELRKHLGAFFTWVKDTVEMLCNRPDHLQRLAIIGAGVSIYPLAVTVIGIIWRGYDRTPELQTQSLDIMGFIAYGLLALFALVVISLLNTIKGLRISGPGGLGIELKTTADDPDVDPSTTRTDPGFSQPAYAPPPVAVDAPAPGAITP